MKDLLSEGKIMKFKLTTTDCNYNEKRMQRLEKLGFRFKPEPERDERGHLNYYHRVGRPYERVGDASIEIATLDELLQLQGKIGHYLILKGDDEIEIYDGFRE